MLSKPIVNFFWALLYLAMLAGIYGALSNYRQYAMEQYGTDSAEQEWQTWREAAADLSDDGPVNRRVPKSTEPPALVLMRDHFAACLGVSLLLSSCLFVWFMFTARGVMKPVDLPGEQTGE